MAKTALQQVVPPQATLNNFTQQCERGIAVFTDGLNLDRTKVHQGLLTTKEWPANPGRVGVGDCMVVYHRIGPGRHFPTTVYVGTVSVIARLNSGLHSYSLTGVRAVQLQGVNWVQFSGSRSRVRYF